LRLLTNRRDELVLVYDKQGFKFKAVIWACLELATVIPQMDHLNNCTVDQYPRYKMLKTAILKKRNCTEMTTIPTMYNQQQIFGASTIP
ncbi:hypothetical protein T11_3582, partial [Trichinella zimbabwensis]